MSVDVYSAANPGVSVDLLLVFQLLDAISWLEQHAIHWGLTMSTYVNP